MEIRDFRYQEKGVSVITSCLELVAFSEATVEDGADGFTRFYESFRGLFGDVVKLYSTANMKSMRPVDSTALDIVPFWFSGQPRTPPKGNLGMEMHSGKTLTDAVPPAFDMFCDRTSDVPNSYFRMVFPVDWIQADAKPFLDLTKSALQDFRLLSGYAGYSFYWQNRVPATMESAAEHYKPWLKRYPGFVHGYPMEFAETALFGVVTADWLTLLGPKYVEELGGTEAISAALGPDLQVHPVGTGIIIQACPLPQIGDVNRRDRLPAYQKVARLLKDVRAPADEAWIEGFSDDEREDWFARFD